MTGSSIQAISNIVSPVVLITSAAILAGGISTMYGAVNDRMRVMTAERLERLGDGEGGMLSVNDLPGVGAERVAEIDAQLPLLLDRHQQLQHALLLCYAAVLLFVSSVVTIAVSVTLPSPGAGTGALVLVLAGTVILLVALGFTARSVYISHQTVDYEVKRVLLLGRR